MRQGAPILAAAFLLTAPSYATQPGAEIPNWRGPSFAHQRQLLQEAEAFMADYAGRLLAGDRTGIAGLYDPNGALLIRNGTRREVSPAEVVARYADQNWQPPARFAWRELHFEAAGSESVAVLGLFEWGNADGSTTIGTYHALLRRGEGRLFIRIEDEAVTRSTR